MKKGLYQELIERFGDERQMAEEGLIFDVSQQLFEVMEKDHVSKVELAKRLGCSKAYITKLLRGPSNMTLRKVAEVFHALGYTLKFKAAPTEDEADWDCLLVRHGRPEYEFVEEPPVQGSSNQEKELESRVEMSNEIERLRRLLKEAENTLKKLRCSIRTTSKKPS